MEDFIALLTQVLGLSFTMGSVTLTLGGIVLGTLALSVGLRFFKRASK